MSTTNKNAVEIRKLKVMLGGQVMLKNLSADIPSGKIVGLLGPSGAGKTTLIRTIVGRQKIASGRVTVLDQDAGAAELRKDIGYMTQSPAVYYDLTVRENVRYFASMRGLGKLEAEEAIGYVKLTTNVKQLFRTLSGGSKIPRIVSDSITWTSEIAGSGRTDRWS